MRISIDDLERGKKDSVRDGYLNNSPGAIAYESPLGPARVISHNVVNSFNHQGPDFERVSMNNKIITKADEISSSMTGSANSYVYLPPISSPVVCDSEASDSGQEEDPIIQTNTSAQYNSLTKDDTNTLDTNTSDKNQNGITTLERCIEPEAILVDITKIDEEEQQENDTESGRPNIPNDSSAIFEMLGRSVAIAHEVPVKGIKGNTSFVKKYKKIFIVAMIILTAGIVSAIVVPLTKRGKSNNDYENENDKEGKNVLTELQSKIKGIAQKLTPLATLEDPTSFQHSALQWMFHNDSFVTVENFNQTKVLQRYICTVLYFSTDGPSWKNQNNFLTNKDTCSWNEVVNGTIKGVTGCNNRGEVTRLYLASVSHNGIVPDEVGYLERLEYLNLNDNNLGGNIPQSIDKLHSLKTLSLDKNKHMRGSIPAGIGMLQNLTLLALHDNKFSGSIPSSIGDLKSLLYLDLSLNNFEGRIPAELGQLTQIKWLLLDHNDFTNSLPAEFSRLTNLRLALFEKNSITGNFSSLCAGAPSSAIIQADCLSDIVSKSAEVDCNCCDLCYNDLFD